MEALVLNQDEHIFRVEQDLQGKLHTVEKTFLRCGVAVVELQQTTFTSAASSSGPSGRASESAGVASPRLHVDELPAAALRASETLREVEDQVAVLVPGSPSFLVESQ